MIRQVREWLYQGGVIKPVHLTACVVSVGNLSLGGTGKSPFVMMMAEWASKRGLPTAVLTRGYKRKKRGLTIVAAHGTLPSVDEVGDEPWMIRNRVPGVSLLVHADRARMAKRHWQELGNPQLVLLDDGFQHWRAARDRDVLMLDASESLTQGTFPFGRLRESASALARADLVVITRAKSISEDALAGLEMKVRQFAASPKCRSWKRDHSPRLRVVAADYVFEHFFHGENGVRCAAPKEKNLILASGVAKPDGVRGLALGLGLPVKEEMYFPDHHRLTSGNLSRLRTSLRAQGDGALVTTEKDWSRWKDDLAGIRTYGMRVKFEFLGDGEKVVEEFFREVELCSTSR